MNLSERININRKEIVTDSYEMSIGELINLYDDGDLIIRPEYQRLFRWKDSQKIKLIESILLWFPLPSIFVFQQPDGKWELIDGLQRLSTIFQFAGRLKGEENLVLSGTEKIPEFNNLTWETLDDNLKRDFKRSRIRVEILKSTSDRMARYELFQRLNTGGAILTEQEIRNCTISMLNPELLTFMQNLAKNPHFVNSISITQDAIQKAYDIELVLRFFSFDSYYPQGERDIHDFLNRYSIALATNEQIDTSEMENAFTETFRLINDAAGSDAFKKRKDDKFIGQFLITKYETITYGIYKNINEILKMKNPNSFIKNKILNLDNQKIYIKYSGSGIRASSRLQKLLTLGKDYFKKV